MKLQHLVYPPMAGTAALQHIALQHVSRITYISILFLFCGCTTGSFFPFSSDPKRLLKHDIDIFLQDSAFAQTTASIKIVSLDRNEVLYDRESSLFLHPASTLKLFTTTSALGILESSYTFKTTLSVDTVDAVGTAGKIYLKGYGDPELHSSDLDTMAAQLVSRGITSVRDGICTDASFFDDQPWGMGWMRDDEPDPDEACISALSVNKNCIEVRIQPSFKIGDPAVVTINPATAFVQVLNSSSTTADSVRHILKIRRPSSYWPNTIIVEGEALVTDTPRTFSVSLRKPELYAGQLLKESLRRHGISIGGSVASGITPSQASCIVVHETSLDSVLIHELKQSDNLSAENILKTLSAQKYSMPPSSKGGIYAVRQFMASMGIDSSKYCMVDGSGISRYNLLSSDVIVQLLIRIYRNPDLFKHFYAALPIAGMDGTLKFRMISTNCQDNLRAKTGTLKGVSCLAGYVAAKDGEFLAFSIMMQNFLGSPDVYRNVQDKICEALAKFSRK